MFIGLPEKLYFFRIKAVSIKINLSNKDARKWWVCLTRPNGMISMKKVYLFIKVGDLSIGITDKQFHSKGE